MGQITATRNLVATKVVRHAGQWLVLTDFRNIIASAPEGLTDLNLELDLEQYTVPFSLGVCIWFILYHELPRVCVCVCMRTWPFVCWITWGTINLYLYFISFPCTLMVRGPVSISDKKFFIRSCDVSKLRDWHMKLSHRFEIWQAHRQQHCQCACQSDPTILSTNLTAPSVPSTTSLWKTRTRYLHGQTHDC